MNAGISRTTAITIGVAVVLVGGIVTALVLTPSKAPSLPPDLTVVEDSPKIGELVEMTHLQILTSTNYLGHRVYIVTANLKNISKTPIRLVKVKLTFLDYEKKVIHEEVQTAYDLKQHPLESGTEYGFEVPFENPPKTWNYHVPDTQVVVVAY
jgi:hypothetical protein